MSVSLINRLKRHKHDEDKISRCKIPRHFYKKLDIESEKGSRTESSHSYGSSRHSPAFTGLAQHTNSCEKEFISNYPCSNNDNDVLNLNKGNDVHYQDTNCHEKAAYRNLPSFQEICVIIDSQPRCSDCAAGKSGHIQHIKQWQPMDHT